MGPKQPGLGSWSVVGVGEGVGDGSAKAGWRRGKGGWFELTLEGLI